MTLSEALALLAQSGLNNPALATPPDIEAAANEAIELIGEKEIDDTTALDIAFYRLKLRLKIATDEADIYLYNAALKRLADAPYKDAGGVILYKVA